MIGAAYCRTMARYNRWQNDNIVSAADTLTDADRKTDRGAFFKSIHGTVSHLLWADTMWMSRFAGWRPPTGGLDRSPAFEPDWARLKARRAEADREIELWAAALTDAAVEGELAWHSAVLEDHVTRPLALCVTHFFNHQTHHRGQIHAMLTAAGAAPGPTDLFLMP